MDGKGGQDVHLLASDEEEAQDRVDDMSNNQLPSYLAEIDTSSAANGRPPLEESSPKHAIQHAKKSSPCSSPTAFIRWAAALSALGGVLFGYDIGIISGALLQLKEEFCLSCFEQEMVVSSMLAGAIIASLAGGFMVDFIGRRVSIMVNSVIFTIGAIILSTAISYPIIIAGRVVVGFAVALSVIAECVYMSEISPPKKRGFFVSLNEFGIVTGFLLAYLVDFAFIQVSNGWRYMFGLSIIPAIIQGIGMCFLPSSPRFLITKNREDEARDVLYFLYDSSKVELELDSIKTAIAQEKSHSSLDLCRNKDNMRYRLMIGMGMVFLQQFTGQPNVLYYGPTVFQSVGFHSNTSATLATVVLGVTKVVGCIIALVLLDRVGRRKCLLAGTILMAISITLLGVVTLFVPSGQFRNPCITVNSSHCPISPNVSNALLESQNRTRRNIDFNRDKMILTLNTQPERSALFQKVIMFMEIFSIKGSDLQNGYRPERDIFVGKQEYRGKSIYENDMDMNKKLKRDLYLDESAINSSSANTTNLTQAPLLVKWVALISLVGFTGSYEIGFGTGTWLVLAEIYPSSIRGRALALATVFNWGTNLLVSLTFLDIMNVFGVSLTFIPYGFISLLAAAFIYIFIPETKGKTLEEIGREFEKSSFTSCFKQCCNKRDETSTTYEKMEENVEAAGLYSMGDQEEQDEF